MKFVTLSFITSIQIWNDCSLPPKGFFTIHAINSWYFLSLTFKFSLANFRISQHTEKSCTNISLSYIFVMHAVHIDTENSHNVN